MPLKNHPTAGWFFGTNQLNSCHKTVIHLLQPHTILFQSAPPDAKQLHCFTLSSKALHFYLIQ
ncbi:hypothetical protein BSZ31_09220 [Limnobacter sp. SAORIC-690]|nr:hypothetical protein BSZ31_09220 [Limnobacter sp. SAORIC-690]